jgi:[acyl-carrier-protein] S-malonyltransferase
VGPVAFVFPGQGSQKVGMARDLWEQAPAARAVLDTADAVLGFPLTRLMFEGPEEELTATENAQPAIVAHSAACLALLEAQGTTPTITAGHSLGEYAAVMAAGALPLEGTLSLVRQRGELMARAGRQLGGGMAAIIGLDTETIAAACARAEEVGTVVIANHNCPGQAVVSGETEAVSEVVRLAKEAGAKRAVPLRVSGAFHSPLMGDAVVEMRALLGAAPFRDAAVPVVSNVDAVPRRDAGAIREALARQITGAVLWEQSVRAIVEQGTNAFLEVGPGAVLAGLIRRIAPEAEVRSVGTVDEVKALPGR